jgi:hypothetical protein
VIDAGFDAAVRLHWPALLRGERITLPFLVPARQRYFPVQVRRIGPVRWQGIDAQSIEVSLDTWYGGIAPRLALVYATPTAPAGVPRHQQPARSTRHLSAGDGALHRQLPSDRQRLAAGVGAAAGRALRRYAQVKRNSSRGASIAPSAA